MTNQTKIETKTAAEVIGYFPLADLSLSSLNPRQDVDADGIALLAESLVTCGLIQNIAGIRTKGNKVEIVAGGRRLRALAIAVKTRPDLGTVPVRLAPNATVALQWANAENTAREELDPVDEIRAYGKMMQQDRNVAKIAQAFGVTEAHVRRRVALAGLPCPVLDALKAGDISFGIAKAMTVSEDEKKILEVLALTKEPYSYVNEYKVKSLLKPDSVSDSSRIAKFVGLEAYIAEGGTVSKDLFEEETLLNAPDLLDRLFMAKLEDAANTLKKAEGWAWVTFDTDSNLNVYELQREQGFARVYKEEGILSEKQTERYEQLIELETNKTLELETDEKLDEKGVAELAALEAITEGEYLKAQKTLAGAMVYVNYSGSLEMVRGLIKAEDQEEAIIAGILEESQHAPSSPAPQKPTAAYSQKFTDDMTAIRLAAVQTALLDKPEFVLDLLAFALSPASGYYNDVLGLRSDNQRNTPEFDEAFTLSPRIGGKRSDEAEEARDKLDDVARQDTPKAFKAFRATGKKQRNTQITEFFARALKTQNPDFMAEIEAEAGADIRSIWTPTASNCFKRLKGAQLDALYMSLLDLKPDNGTFKAFSVHKKAAKVEVMHSLFNDPAHQKLCGVTANQKAKIDAWTPECF